MTTVPPSPPRASRPSDRAAADPEQLPRGRHNLTREQVAASQRSRMMVAIADAMAEKGYVGTSVADVLQRAGVSRETFYQQFASKLDCFMHAFDAAAEVLLAHVGRADDGTGTPIERFERSFTTYVETLAAHPALARVFLVEVYAAGPEALERRAAVQAKLVDDIAWLLGADSPQDRFACQVLVAAVGAMVTGPVIAGDADALGRLRTDVVALVRRAVGHRDGE